MKFSLNKLVIAAVLAIPAVTMASTGGSGMLGGRHDFASGKSKFIYKQADVWDDKAVNKGGVGLADQVGLCSFCHTPHSANSTALLWNRKANTKGYNWGDAATTTGGTKLGMLEGYVGPTAKCLACHDGSVAVGDVANYQGQSRYSTDGRDLNGYKVGDRALEATDSPNYEGDFKNTKKVGAGNTNIAKNGTGMAGAHPVGVPYPFGGAINTYNSVDTGNDVVLEDYVSTPTVSKAGVAGVKLYNDTGTAISAGAVPGKTGIECSSCHDVHNKQSVDDNMLRGKNYGSKKSDGYLCLQCHAKAE